MWNLPIIKTAGIFNGRIDLQMDMLSFDSPSFWLSNQLKKMEMFQVDKYIKKKIVFVLSLTDSLHELPHQPVSCDSRKAKIPVLHNRIIPIMMKGSLKPPTWNKNMYIMEWKKDFVIEVQHS